MKAINKKSIFIKAWELFRSLGISFSDALKQAWSIVKKEMAFLTFSGYEVYNYTSFDGTKVTAYRKDNVQAGNLNRLFEMWYNHKQVNNDGAQAYYDGKTFNND